MNIISIDIEEKNANDFQALCVCTSSIGVKWELRGQGADDVSAIMDVITKAKGEDETKLSIFGYVIK